MTEKKSQRLIAHLDLTETKKKTRPSLHNEETWVVVSACSVEVALCNSIEGGCCSAWQCVSTALTAVGALCQRWVLPLVYNSHNSTLSDDSAPLYVQTAAQGRSKTTVLIALLRCAKLFV